MGAAAEAWAVCNNTKRWSLCCCGRSRGAPDRSPPVPAPLRPAFPGAVTDLAGRIFATWTLTSCMLCLICARNPCVPAIYGAFLATLVCCLAL